MSVNAYPLIYTRTRCHDFLSENFLIQPDEFKNSTVREYSYNKVCEAINGLDSTNDVIRHVVFNKEEYIVCGISCTTSALTKKCNINKDDICPNTDKPYSYYLRDENNRNIQCFIGLVFKFDDLLNSNSISIPKFENLNFFLDLFLEYTHNQWERKVVETENISKPKEVAVLQLQLPLQNIDSETFKDKTYIFEDNIKKVVEYYFNKLSKPDIKDLAMIYKMEKITEDLHETSFTDIVTTRNLFENIKFLLNSENNSKISTTTSNDEPNSNSTPNDNTGFGPTVCSTAKNNNSNNNSIPNNKSANKNTLASNSSTPNDNTGFGSTLCNTAKNKNSNDNNSIPNNKSANKNTLASNSSTSNDNKKKTPSPLVQRGLVVLIVVIIVLLILLIRRFGR